MQRVAKAALQAAAATGKSVEYARQGAVDEAFTILSHNPEQVLHLFGIKDTDQIPRAVAEGLQELPGFIFHTVDKMASGGRALDPNLVNPLTGRVMTGSSSASCINILLGINDLAVGTDGGGSVLAPAFSTGLYSIMAKGLGLKGHRSRVSTDSIPFFPGLGIISHSYDLCLKAVSHLSGVESGVSSRPRLAMVQPRGPHLKEVLQVCMDVLSSQAEIEVLDNPACSDRPGMLDFLQREFARFSLLLSFEGPVDLMGYGDSVLGKWGSVGRELQTAGGKELMKVANMMDATAVGIPAGELSSGVLVMAPPGKDSGQTALAVGALLAEALPQPQLFQDYFFQAWSRPGWGYI